MARVLLNGSVNLPEAEAVFRTVSEIAGDTVPTLPEDTSKLVAVAVADAQLELEPSTRLYLGLVHSQDGSEGTDQRIATGKRHWPDFGLATECGIGRKATELVLKLLCIRREATV